MQDDFIKAEGWEEPIYNSENEREGSLFLLTETGDTLKEDTDLFRIKMKVLEKVPTKDTQIKFTQISSSNGEEDIEIADVLTNFKVQGNMTILDSIWIYVAIGVAIVVSIAIAMVVLVRKRK